MARRSRTTIVGTPSVRQGTYAAAQAKANSEVAVIDGTPNVAFERRELREVMHLYDKITDCIAGSHAIKVNGEKYLARPNPEDVSLANRKRYEAYLQRAVFYNVTRRTIFGLVGQIFLRDPQFNLPTNLQVLLSDANGEGVSLEQVGHSAAQHVVSLGRAGYFVDYPSIGRALTRDDLESGDIRPIIQEYSGREITNWRKALRGARSVYTLIVVKEDYTVHDDGFEAKTEQQYKVLRLISAQAAAQQIQEANPETWEGDYGVAINNALVSPDTDVYRLEIWRMAGTGTSARYSSAVCYFPRDFDGNFLNELPWQFIGAEKNDDRVDHPPVADLAELNIGHFQNSADYEETSFITGQPTPVVTGVTEEWNATVLKGSIQLGSRGTIPLPVGGTALLLQAEANGVPFEAMQHKERQMVALGAKLIEQRSVQRTATEAQIESTADTSILASIAQNVSNALEAACKIACKFTGDNPDDVSINLNTEFDLTHLDPAERQQLMLEWQSGAISFQEYRANLKRTGVASLDDTDALAQIQKEQALKLATEVEGVKQKAEAVASVQPPTAAPAAAPKG